MGSNGKKDFRKHEWKKQEYYKTNGEEMEIFIKALEQEWGKGKTMNKQEEGESIKKICRQTLKKNIKN